MTADSQPRAVDKLIAALNAADRDDEAAVVQELRPDITTSHVTALRRNQASP